MGRANCVPKFLEICPHTMVDSQIHTQDDFIREHSTITPDPQIRQIWHPFWRFRSEYQDSIYPVEENTRKVFKLRRSITDTDTEALTFDPGSSRHSRIEIIIMEAAGCHKIYCTYLSQLRRLLSRVIYVYNTIKMRNQEMLEEFAMNVDYEPNATERYSQNIYFALRMALILIEAMVDSIKTGKRVLACSADNMIEMSRIYYKLKLPLPLDPFCGHIVAKNLKKFEKIESECQGTSMAKKESEKKYGDFCQASIK